MSEEKGYIDLIESCSREITRLFKSKTEWVENDEQIVTVFNILYSALYQHIHKVLVPEKKESSEKKIRELIAKYVIGYNDKKKKIVYIGSLKPIYAKLSQVECSVKVKAEYLSRYLDLYDDFFALAAFRSLRHFALYLEKNSASDEQMDDEEGGGNGGDTKIIENTQEIFAGWYHYANKMVLDGSVKFIEKQLPTSYGKSYSDVILICYIYGQDINNDVLKVFGNPYNCKRCIKSITDIMCRKSYAKVFPYFQQFNGKKALVFENCSEKDGEFKIAGSKKPTNFLCVGKESKISGVRARYIFLDDITQAEDADNIRRHDSDIDTYRDVWRKRTYGKNNTYIIASGTTYSIYDILSYLKKKFGIEASVDTNFKYTKCSKSNEIISGGISVFVCVPKLDYVTDESTYPQQFDTFSARKDREEDYETFMAMEQQQPIAPKGNPFYYTNLREYETLPKIGENGRSEYCQASLDGKRKGADYCSMPIFTVINDEHFLIDVFYDNRPMKDCYGGLCTKIIQHNIKRLVIENNINEGLKTLLLEELAKRDYTCTIDEVFNYEQKDMRISNSEADIKAKMVFPKFGLYARSSPIGMAMEELYGYSYTKKVAHDDFTDSLATYSKHFIEKRSSGLAVLQTFRR
jgi:hypothetical protein